MSHDKYTHLVYGVKITNSKLPNSFLEKFSQEVGHKPEQWDMLELVSIGESKEYYFGLNLAETSGKNDLLEQEIHLDPTLMSELPIIIADCLSWYRIKVEDMVPKLVMVDYLW
jgi:hypothetical protein